MKATQLHILRLRVEACRQHTPRAFSRWYVKRLSSARLTRKHRLLRSEIDVLAAQKEVQERHMQQGTAGADSDKGYLGMLAAGLAWRNELLGIIEKEEISRGTRPAASTAVPMKVRPKRL